MNGLRYLCALSLSCLVWVSVPGDARAAEPPSLEALWQIVQQQQAQIETLTQALDGARAQIANTEQRARITEEQLDLTAGYLEKVDQGRGSGRASRTTLGGYGEMHYNNLDAEDSSRDLKEVDFHRFVAFVGHEFTDRIRFFSEVELEHSLVQDTADGSSGGEVEIEQAYLEFDLNESLTARGGLFLLPIGILNETHEPNTFYGVERNEVESIIIPSTWWEGGAALSGHYSNGLSWDFAVHSGLETPTSGSSAYRIRSGRQKVSNASADNLALTARLKYTGVPGLELAASVNYQDDASQIGGDGLEDGTLVSVHGIWSRGPFNLRALWSQWNFNGDAIELADADRQTGWYVEPSLRLGRPAHDWGVYSRYQDLEGARAQDQFDQWEVGVNYWPTGNVVLKFDYRDRSHDLLSAQDRDFKGIDLGVGYQF
ncbi:MAG: hypothetical protein KDI31_16835 [Pseudomonadales bacterium]|nr:hypothetical protein [Pseudomonadales bacterium]